ncbi:MAG: hypothetical protein J0H57_03240, partial [Rhodospirillales bacterium]|nr:hypothetical protein [Rhodospirillales bacterium]
MDSDPTRGAMEADATRTSPADATADLPAAFDELLYLQAFPDVATAIEAGICESPLQHYLEHGRHEDRLSHDGYVALLQGRELEGFIDFYGYSAHAGGWLFCG